MLGFLQLVLIVFNLAVSWLIAGWLFLRGGLYDVISVGTHKTPDYSYLFYFLLLIIWGITPIILAIINYHQES